MRRDRHHTDFFTAIVDTIGEFKDNKGLALVETGYDCTQTSSAIVDSIVEFKDKG